MATIRTSKTVPDADSQQLTEASPASSAPSSDHRPPSGADTRRSCTRPHELAHLVSASDQVLKSGRAGLQGEDVSGCAPIASRELLSSAMSMGPV